MKSFSLAVAITTACFLLTSCGPTDADKISDAQTCLNTATPANADLCVAMVAGITSQSAALIRCSGAFIKQGYGDPSKVAGALSQIDGSSGATQSIAMMTKLSFQYESTMAANVTDAQTAQSDCNISESPGLIFLVGVAATATQAAQLAGSSPGSVNSADVTTGLGTIASGG